MSKMSNRKKIFIAFCFFVLDAFLIIGFLVIRDAISYNKLKKEMDIVYNLDITKDKYDRKIKSSGKYGDVEKVIKKHLENVSSDLRDISLSVNDDKIKNMLSYDNYYSDGVEFNSSISYLTKAKSEFNNKVSNLEKQINQDNIKDYVNKEIDDDYYRSVCTDLILSDEMKKNYKSISDYVNEISVKMNNIYDVSLEILNYLKSNPNSWKLEEGKIKFQNQESYNYYNSLTSKLN